MKTKLFLITILATSISLAQEKTVNLSLGAKYTNQVYYKLDSETKTEYLADSWDIAFLRTSNRNQSIRVNDGAGIEVFEAANSASEWANIDLADKANWKQLYNSDITRSQGAFMEGSATFGWGEYNPTTHTVNGTIIFVLKYADDTYKKFICESYLGAYTIKYASWNSTTKIWDEDKTATISNTSNPAHNYNYFSLKTDQEVVAEPEATNWDFVFTKYYTEVSDGQGGSVKYPVTGVLLSDNVTVATATGDDTSNLEYHSNINSIGYDWKALSATWQWEIDSNKKYYIKYENGTIYKLYFTDFEGSSTGNLEFKFENVTASLSTDSFYNDIAFTAYPNPVNDDRTLKINFNNTSTNTKSTLEIYNIAGQSVFKTEISSKQSILKEVNLSSLNSGIYMMKFNSGSYQKTKKLILQ
jgi:hypothetical protein